MGRNVQGSTYRPASCRVGGRRDDTTTFGPQLASHMNGMESYLHQIGPFGPQHAYFTVPCRMGIGSCGTTFAAWDCLAAKGSDGAGSFSAHTLGKCMLIYRKIRGMYVPLRTLERHDIESASHVRERD